MTLDTLRAFTAYSRQRDNEPEPDPAEPCPLCGEIQCMCFEPEYEEENRCEY